MPSIFRKGFSAAQKTFSKKMRIENDYKNGNYPKIIPMRAISTHILKS